MKHYIATLTTTYNRYTSTDIIGLFGAKSLAKKTINDIIKEDDPWRKGRWEDDIRETYDDDVSKTYCVEQHELQLTTN